MSEPIADATKGAAAEKVKRPIDWTAFISQSGTVLILLASIIFFTIQDERFLTLGNLRTTLATGAPLMIVALGLTVVLVMGDFDLSISGMFSLGGAIIVVLIVNHGWGWGWAVLAALAFAVVVGLVNGTLIAYLGTSSFITTLATGIVLIGIEFALTDGRFVTGAGKIPDSYRDLGIGTPESWVGFASPVWIAAALALVLWVLLAKTEIGRYMYAIGGNPEAARLSGIPTRRLRTLGFIVVAVVCVIGAMTQTARTASSIPNSGASLLLPAYAATFLGAAMSRRGQFNIPGTVLGVLFLQVIQSGLTFMGYNEDVQNIAQGTILIGAMLLSRLGANRQ
jgi:ribose transport system permease protein